MGQERTHYEVLGISRTASVAEVKSAFRRAARATHPDHGGDVAEFRLVSLAYETLSDTAARAAYDRGYGGASAYRRPSSDDAASYRGEPAPTAGPAPQKTSATAPPRYVPAFEPGTVPVLERAVAAQRIHGAPRKRGIFGAQARLAREARTVQLLSGNVLEVLPATRLVNGLHSPADNGHLDHAVLAGYRLALVDSMLLPRGVYRWDGESLLRDGKGITPPRLAPSVRRMQELFPELNVTGWTVIHAPDGNLHEPVIDYARGADPSSSASVHVVNAANLVRELKMFLGTGPTPNVVDVPVLARLLGGMY
ncbi:J domain-containing protein [Arthrobacter sp. KK5.5]|uniref:J domain-containing protein n=1 Tax=Arthrobacter sp. KK5.5 TaxID=3373084 RepID=UPI003EE73C16